MCTASFSFSFLGANVNGKLNSLNGTDLNTDSKLGFFACPLNLSYTALAFSKPGMIPSAPKPAILVSSSATPDVPFAADLILSAKPASAITPAIPCAISPARPVSYLLLAYTI